MIKIFYHSADFDGKASAAIVHQYCIIKRKPAWLIGINYGYDFKESVLSELISGDEIYVVDFSFTPEEFKILKEKTKSITWIDHHKTIIENKNYEDLKIPGIRFDGQKAACELTWEYLFPTSECPLGIKLLSWYDIWAHYLDERILPFQYGLRIYNTDVIKGKKEIWDPILFQDNSFISKIVEEGKIVLRYIEQEFKEYAKVYSYETIFEGLKILVCNRGKAGFKLFDSVFDPIKHDAVITFVYHNGGWNFSMYSSKKEIDCSKIAKKYGGGGHKSACGWRMNKLPAEFLNSL